MFERFTAQARSAVEGARDAAVARGDGHVGPEHLLLALAAPGSGPAAGVLADQGVAHEELLRQADRLARRPSVVTEQDLAVLSDLGIDGEGLLQKAHDEWSAADPVGAGQPARRRPGVPYTATAKKCLECSLREAVRLRDKYIGTEHLLLGLLRQGGVGCDLLTAAGADLDALRRRAEQARTGAA